MIRINNVQYDISNSFSIDERLDEALDSGCVKILNITDRELTFKPTTELYIEEFGNVYDYFVIDYCEDEIVSFNPFLKNINVFFIERTKLLERHTLSNHSITQSLIGNHKTIGTFINNLIKVYDLPYTLDVEFANEFAPEVSFSQPTFKEVLDLLFMIYDSVPFLQNDNKIIAIPLQKNNKEINTNYLHKIEYSQKMEDYCDGLDMSVENTYAENPTSTTLIKSFRSDDIIMNDGNYCIYLDKPIYQINKYLLYYQTLDATSNKVIYSSVDISNYVYDEREYQTLNADKKKKALYYKFGDNYIKGYTNTQGFFGKPAIENIFLEVKPNNHSYLGIDFLFHQVDYNSSDVFKVKTEKNNSENLSYLFNTQSETYIDVKETGKNLYNRTDRVGNKKMTIYGIYLKNVEIPNLGDYIGKYILVQKKLQINKNFTVFVGELSYNYIRKNEFIALASFKRVYQFDIEGASVRNVLSKNKIKLSLKEQTSTEFEYLLFNWINKKNISNKLPVEVQVNYYEMLESDKYLLDSNIHRFGKSFLITFGFADNFRVANKVGENVTGGKEMLACRYVDEKGECESLLVNIYSKWNNLNDEFIPYQELKDATDNLPISNDLFVNNENMLDSFNVLIHKDNREIIKVTKQYEILSDDDVFITDYFYDNHPIIKGDESPLYNYKIMTQTIPFTKDQIKCNGVIRSDVSVEYLSHKIQINNINAQYVAITDNNGNIIISLNYLQNQKNVVIYL